MFLNFKRFLNRRIEKTDCLVFIYCGMISIFSIYCLLFNTLVTKYPGNHYLPWQWLLLLPFVIFMYGVASYAHDIAPRLAFFTRFYTLYYFIITAMSLMTNGVQFTPFPTVDHIMSYLDKSLGVDTDSILLWTSSHPFIKKMLIYAYNTVTLEMFILPVALGVLLKKRSVNEFLLLTCLSYLLGYCLYYFFPTAAPASVFQSPHFLPQELATALKFQQIHHHVVPTTRDGGLIAFPSFHVIFSLLCVYVIRDVKWLLVPLAIINVIAIFSTVALGWHYLTDVFGGIFVLVVTIFITRLLLNPKKGDNCH